MEDPLEQETQNTLNNSENKILNTNLLEKDSDTEDENENETQIISREIKASKTTIFNELKLTDQKDNQKDNSDLIKFNMKFADKEYKYSWIVYHTPKEVRKHIKKFLQTLAGINYPLLIRKSFNNNINPKLYEIKTDKNVIDNLSIIEDFYLKLFKNPKYENDPFLLNFFNISKNSFLKENAGKKPFEGWISKKADKHCCRKCFQIFCKPCELCFFNRYNRRWIVLQTDHLFYLNDPMIKEGKTVYFLDKDMKINSDGEDRLIIINNSMKLILKFNSFFEREIWKNELVEERKNLDVLSKYYYKYDAYATAKKYNLCKWFIDGKSYFDDLFEKLMDAKKCIYITDWWMSPEVFLRRPVDEKIYIEMAKKNILAKDLSKNKISRLMDILNYKANQGVKIYIMIYYEVSLAVTLNSEHTKNTLEKLNSNIKVTRHPSGAGTLLWSHHEKLVVIDNIIGYVGGLDLCWGRYDTPSHPIYEPPNPEGIYHFPLIDYSNARICDFEEVQNYTIESVPRKECARMPWHDVHARIIGPSVNDIFRHFIERWNQANFSERKEKGLTAYDQRASFEQNKVRFDTKLTSIIKTKSREIENENSLKKIESTQTIKLAKKDSNKIGTEEEKILEEKFMKGKKQIDEDHLLVRLDSKNNDKEYNKPSSTITLNSQNVQNSQNNQRPTSYDNIVKGLAKSLRRKMTINVEDQMANDKLYKKYFVPGSITSMVHVLRSSSEWSAGLKTTENSILKAYYDLINNAEHYIYIENQFFISKSWTQEEKNNCTHHIKDIVINEVALCLRNRIKKAYIKKENFKVFIFIPLLPGFKGEPEKESTIQIILKHTYATICRNYGLSIIEGLYKDMGDKWKDYIGFYSLRNHGLINNVPKTELLYIHSKLMIVDDTKVLIGSANINDRSLIGKRDSEFAVLIKEQKFLIDKSTQNHFIMDGKPYKGTHFATSFRKSLMAEHLGLNKDDPILIDPVDNKLFSLINSRAQNNTKLYRDIFNCYPDDTFTNFKLMKEAKRKQESENPEILLQNYLKLKDKIIGHIVEFPLHFLKEETLGKIFFTKENMVPENNFT